MKEEIKPPGVVGRGDPLGMKDPMLSSGHRNSKHQREGNSWIETISQLFLRTLAKAPLTSTTGPSVCADSGLQRASPPQNSCSVYPCVAEVQGANMAGLQPFGKTVGTVWSFVLSIFTSNYCTTETRAGIVPYTSFNIVKQNRTATRKTDTLQSDF